MTAADDAASYGLIPFVARLMENRFQLFLDAL
jgi:hypothetical protein